MNRLEEARKEIDEIDAQMAVLYEKRLLAARDVAAYKIEHNLPVFDKSREQAVIDKNVERIQHNEFKKSYESFLHFLMDQSKSYQKSLLSTGIVAYAGVEGAFAHMVSEELFPENQKLPCNSFEEVIQSVLNQKAEFGILPFENNNSGLVGEVLDALQQYPVYIRQAVDKSVDQCLLGLPEATLKDIQWVYSKDQALAQAKDFLDSLDVEVVPYPNTALAAQYVASAQDVSKAAIGARENAMLYNLKVLASRIEVTEANTTRFLVIAREPAKEKGDHFSLIISVRNEVGALAKVIDILARHHMNMDCIQSRVVKGRDFEYFFYIQCFGQIDDENIQASMQDLKTVSSELKWMGSYSIQQEEKK